MCKCSREDSALRQDPPDITAVRATWIRLHGPASERLGVGRAAREAAHGLDRAQWYVVRGGIGLHGHRDARNYRILAPFGVDLTHSLQGFSI